jgi:hypothetical protein
VIPLRGWIVPIAAVLVLVATGIKSRAEHVACEEARQHVAKFGKGAVIAWAVAKGLSREEISRIRKLCGI